ncbi:MAG: BON domain-containing protein [Gammaproteobacteria bacterium]|nr:BON domain-containing protein [Gammaproteobacteria bacterium]
MTRWMTLLIIGFVVVVGGSGCVLVVADETVAQEIKEQKNSSRLERSLEKELDTDDALQYSDIDVEENDGVITLSGDADSMASLQYAIDLVARRGDVTSVVSKVRVEVRLD